MANALSDQLVTRLRSLLRSADHPSGAAGSAAEWRAERDRWLDALDPREPRELGGAGIRHLIDFLSESGPSRASRRTPAEWSRVIDALVPELLFVAQSGLP
jgi:hypothetical protein